jgi:hypothetical protein
MKDPNRYNPRNAAIGEANTKLVLASLKAGPKTITELMMVTSLTRPTVIKKLNQLIKEVAYTATRPAKYYLREQGYQTVVDEVVEKNASPTKLDAVKRAIVNAPIDPAAPVVFFPKADYNDHSKFHDFILSSSEPSLVQQAYLKINSNADIARFEAAIKTMHDLIQFRKKLKEFED